jgi:hypothetical protein
MLGRSTNIEQATAELERVCDEAATEVQRVVTAHENWDACTGDTQKLAFKAVANVIDRALQDGHSLQNVQETLHTMVELYGSSSSSSSTDVRQ